MPKPIGGGDPSSKLPENPENKPTQDCRTTTRVAKRLLSNPVPKEGKKRRTHGCTPLNLRGQSSVLVASADKVHWIAMGRKEGSEEQLFEFLSDSDSDEEQLFDFEQAGSTEAQRTAEFKRNFDESFGLDDCSVLEHLNINTDSVATIESGLRELTEINLSGVGIRVIPPSLVDKCPNIRTITIQDCNLERLPDNMDQWEQLQEVNAHGNRISQLPNSLLEHPNLESLNVAHNLLSELPQFSCQRLTNINLSNNRMTNRLKGHFMGCPSLDTVDLSHNQLKGNLSDQFCDSMVKNLDLSFNRLCGPLMTNSFNFQNLERLNVSYNELEEVVGSFQQDLREADLSNNRLTVISNDAFSQCNVLSSLNISNNEHLGQNNPFSVQLVDQCVSLSNLNIGGCHFTHDENLKNSIQNAIRNDNLDLDLDQGNLWL